MKKVALCMILKNEGMMLDFILSALASKFPLVVANDYGSTDGTQAILEKHGVNWREWPWPNSYADARNLVMDRAFDLGAEAVFFLDGDEMIWPDTVESILNLDVPLAQFPRVNLRPGRRYEDFSYPDYQPRYLTRDYAFRYTNRLHEVVTNSAGKFATVDIKIFHYNHFKGPEFMWLKNHNYARINDGLETDWGMKAPDGIRIADAGIPWVDPIPLETLFSHDWFSPNIPTLKKFIPENQPLKILEIGCYEGMASRWFLENYQSIMLCVDTFKGAAEHKELGIPFDWVKQRFWFNVDPWREKVELFEGTSTEFFHKNYDRTPFDVVYVDGSHEAPDVLSDCVQGLQRLKSGGLMVMDDYGWDRYEDVTHNPRLAIDAFLAVHAGQMELVSKEYQVIARKK